MRNIVTFSAILCFAGVYAQSMTTDAISYQDRLYIDNISSGSLNPTSIIHSPIPAVSDFKVEYSHSDGELKEIDRAGTERWWNASIYGIRKIKRLAFEGGISYKNGTLKNKRWNNTLFVSSRNPYIIADSIAGEFSPEIFNLHGNASYIVSNKLNIGLRAIYNVGSSAKQKDPRPDIKGMRFTLNPGAEYLITGNWGVGLSANIGWLSESASHSVVRTDVPQYIFIFQGLGNHEVKEAIGYKRKYAGFNFSGATQVTYRSQNINNLFEFGYGKENETAEDGTTGTLYNGGRYNNSSMLLSNRLELRRDKMIHNFTLSANMSDTEGTWFTQKQVTDDNGNLFWQIINESVEYTSQNYNAAIDYRMDIMDGNIPSLTLFAGAKINNNEKRNRIYGAFQKYMIATVELYAAKNFKIKKNRLKIFIDAGLRECIENDINLDEFPANLNNMMQQYTMPAYFSDIAGRFTIGGGAQFNIPLKIHQFSTFLGLSAKYQYSGYTKNAPIMQNTDRNNITAALNFTF